MAQATRNGSQNASEALASCRDRRHTITCPSGQKLRIRIPGVETILQHGDLPNDLWQIALDEITRDDGAVGGIAERVAAKPRDEQLKEILGWAAFQRELVRAAVVAINTGDDWADVTLTDDDLAEVPDADVELVAMLVLRVRSTDARGVTVGVEPIDRWDLWRRLHGCKPDCEACENVLSELTTT